jgi:glycosyltransferase involved in cell wall biosynthesis
LLRIALLCESFHALGGVAQIVEELALAFARAGHRVAIVSNPDRRAKSVLRRQTSAVEQIWLDLPRAKPFSLRHPERLVRRYAAPQLSSFIHQWAPDVLNIHGGLRDRFPGVLAACRRPTVPLVQSFHLVPGPFTEDAEAARLKGFTSKALATAAAITFPSTAVKEGFQRIWPAASQALIIRGGVNLEDAARSLPFRRERPYIFSASRLDLRHKAVDALVHGFALIAAEFPDVDLLIAGDGPQQRQIEEMIVGLSLERRIFLLSALPHDELWSLYKGALLFVMLSRMAEGLPLVFFEAMACGIPVIGTRSGGTPEVVLHEETGLLVGDNEPSTVAEAMRALLATRDERERLGRRGYECAKQYDWGQAASLYVEVYHDLLRAQQ